MLSRELGLILTCPDKNPMSSFFHNLWHEPRNGDGVLSRAEYAQRNDRLQSQETQAMWNEQPIFFPHKMYKNMDPVMLWGDSAPWISVPPPGVLQWRGSWSKTWKLQAAPGQHMQREMTSRSTLLQLSIYSSILEILDFGRVKKHWNHILKHTGHLNFTDNRQPKIIKNCGWFPPSAGFGVTWGVHEASTLRYLVECEESGPLQYRVVASWCI